MIKYYKISDSHYYFKEGNEMIKFKDKRNDIIKEAYDIEFKDNKVFIKFTENGKAYGYSSSNIDILNKQADSELFIYTFKYNCYKCKRDTNIFLI